MTLCELQKWLLQQAASCDCNCLLPAAHLYSPPALPALCNPSSSPFR